MADAVDTTFELHLRGTAAQAAGCFERKLLADSQPKQEIALAMLTRSLILAKSTAVAQRDGLIAHSEKGSSVASGETSPINKEISSALIRKKSKINADRSDDNDDDRTYGDYSGDDGTFTNKQNTKQSILDECLPCLDRALDVDLMAPLEDLLFDFENDLEDRWNTLDNIWDLLNSDDVYEDLCDLIDFFSLQCLPDLVAILSLLLWLWKSLLEAFQIDINGSLWSLIGLMLGPMLSSLESIIQQYMDMLMAPIDCIISSLLFQMSKIPQFESDQKWLFEREQEQKTYKERGLTGAIGGSIDANTVNINAAIDAQLNVDALKATSWDQSKEYYQTQAYKEERPDKGPGQSRTFETITPITVEDRETIAAETGGEPGSPEEEARLERKAYIEEREARERKVATTADWLMDGRNVLQSGLGQIGSYLIAGRDRMNSWLASIRDDLRSFLFGSGTGFTNAVSLTETISRLAIVIGFVKALIKMAEDGFDCGDDRDDLTEPAMINFLQNYFAPEVGATVTVGEDGDVIIIPAGASTQGTGTTVPAADSALAIEADTQSRTGITISIPGCLNRTDAADLRKVEEWIKQISQ